jgi:UDPglucose 6-dehydrogenase
MATRVERAAGGDVRDKSIAVLGVTFKPNTDDMREAPSLTIISILQGKGARIRIYDPQGRRYGEALLGAATWCESALQAAESADIVLVLTEWNEFRALDLAALKRAMRGNLLVDTRNIYLPADARAAGLRYVGVGRGSGTLRAAQISGQEPPAISS